MVEFVRQEGRELKESRRGGRLMSREPEFELPFDAFSHRHIGPRPEEVEIMLRQVDARSMDEFISSCVPEAIRLKEQLDLPEGLSEDELLNRARDLAKMNRLFKNYIGMGYYGTFTPPVIQRNIMENPAWYTAYTPYQAEISQGRMEALLNFQTMVADLTGLPMANASLLDEGTAAAEAMALCLAASKSSNKRFFVADNTFPQTLEVLKTRALPLGVEIVTGEPTKIDLSSGFFGAFMQYLGNDGSFGDVEGFAQKAKANKVMSVLACDLLALCLTKSPGEFGIDIAVGNSQRFGVPLGYGGPHAAFISTRDEFKRLMPGRIIGVSKDADGQTALRLALQTREQHIRREKATSNICTAQVLLAVMASMYAVYHGPKGLKAIADRVNRRASGLAQSLKLLGYELVSNEFFDTLQVRTGPRTQEILARANEARLNLRPVSSNILGISLDETTSDENLETLVKVFAPKGKSTFSVYEQVDLAPSTVPARFNRSSDYLTHSVFNTYHSESEMLRYIFSLQNKDLSLTHSMIPLGSCTMKLNATAEMMPVTWPKFGQLHPFAPHEQVRGYSEMIEELEKWLATITGFDGVSLQPNAGSQGEYTGLLVIQAYHHSKGDQHRNVCLIPSSAHGTNPASAVMAGMKVVVVACDEQGNVDLNDLRAKAQEHRKSLSALMITYPSTHGVFEEEIKEICQIVHDNGGQVYMDGANMNAMVGLSRPGDIGADVCHLNLHKTFCIPHGGGGPGVGPTCVAKHLSPFLPRHPLLAVGGEKGIGAVSSAPWGSAGILSISWAYIAMMGRRGLQQASMVAILNANYIAKRLEPYYPVLYRGRKGRVAHECILDVRPFKQSADVTVDDIAKRLMDYGFHAPTMSWPVAGTLMIEPTESESKSELDRFCEAMISIREEIAEIENGKADREDNLLKGAPHPAARLLSDTWQHKYSRERAAYPLPWVKMRKFWPSVGRVDNAYGDKNFMCTCPPLNSYES